MRDIGVKAAAKSKGLNELARCTPSHSERDFQTLTSKFQLKLPIDLTALPKTLGIRYTGDFHALSLRNWLKFHIDYNTWHILTGLARPNPQREKDILSEFWRRYHLLHPNHQLWQFVADNNIDLSHTAPLIFHGDEGRGRKRAAFLVAAYHSYLGLGTEKANSSRKSKPYLVQKLNYSGNSHTHRMLTAVLPKMLKDEAAFQEILKFITADALGVLKDGVISSTGVKYHAAVLQVSGDWVFLAKCGSLSRSFSNVEKRPRAQGSKPKGICHCCKAGQLQYPFEDLRKVPKWRATLFDPEDTPFLSRPLLLNLPHDPARAPGFFCFDLWHAFHLGVGKTLTASILAMISVQLDGSNIEERFACLTRQYLDFCQESHESPFITSISKETLGWPDTKTHPNAQWSKGHITVLMMDFIADWFECNGVAGDPLFPLAKEAVGSINTFMQRLYSSDLWIEAADGREIAQIGFDFLLKYMTLAKEAFESDRSLFIFMPKIHVVHHVIDTLWEQSCAAPYALNPLAHAVQVSEDYVGRISRVSRRVSPLQAITRTLQRSLQASRWHYVQQGYLRGWRKNVERPTCATHHKASVWLVQRLSTIQTRSQTAGSQDGKDHDKSQKFKNFENHGFSKPWVLM